MYLEDVVIWLKTLQIKFSNYCIGEVMSAETEALGIYILYDKDSKPQRDIGGISSHTKSSFRLLVRGSDNASETQKKAVDFYRLLEQTLPTTIGNKAVIALTLLTQEPQPHSKDESGKTYEIDFSLTYER